MLLNNAAQLGPFEKYGHLSLGQSESIAANSTADSSTLLACVHNSSTIPAAVLLDRPYELVGEETKLEGNHKPKFHRFSLAMLPGAAKGDWSTKLMLSS